VKENATLTFFSLLTILLGTVHIADDITRGMSPGGLLNLVGVGIWVVWLYVTIVLAGRRSGYIGVLVFSLLMFAVPIIHMRGPGIGFGTRRSDGLLFVWTLFTIGVTSLFTAILAARALLSLRRNSQASVGSTRTAVP
jgi:hypothetical protein